MKLTGFIPPDITDLQGCMNQPESGLFINLKTSTAKAVIFFISETDE